MRASSISRFNSVASSSRPFCDMLSVVIAVVLSGCTVVIRGRWQLPTVSGPAVPASCWNWFPFHWNDVVGLRRPFAVGGPCVHQFTALLHCPAPAIGSFGGITDGMGE